MARGGNSGTSLRVAKKLVPCALKVGSHSFPFSAQFFDFSIPAGRTQEGAGVDTPSGSSANNLNILSHG